MVVRFNREAQGGRWVVVVVEDVAPEFKIESFPAHFSSETAPDSLNDLSIFRLQKLLHWIARTQRFRMHIRKRTEG